RMSFKVCHRIWAWQGNWPRRSCPASPTATVHDRPTHGPAEERLTGGTRNLGSATRRWPRAAFRGCRSVAAATSLPPRVRTASPLGGSERSDGRGRAGGSSLGHGVVGGCPLPHGRGSVGQAHYGQPAAKAARKQVKSRMLRVGGVVEWSQL